mmetsp:Transcript_5114/g.6768  ORF Transcript_5114/g.6768 Transcript_5114/m.6768 type:complete len:183 (-) Transcript_5114:407-955(-)|eukprot:CAMPEP_0185263878 /NCGR_PEP_ID=MMETSP1359-20130426/16932_1 /TAXON_ID=552665 /ORGANISM="Bigelowiella longifila, Strain CCMP242" /LENGTH=182 /DNA_ID=CAMNT_0027851751 /DNA_START=74 /DNA_END=622 /DNA_ORIENTATION=-
MRQFARRLVTKTLCFPSASRVLKNTQCRRLSTSAKPAPGNPFHLAIPVHDIKQARSFYGGVLSLEEGRRDGDKWQDYSINGHQLVCHWVGSDYKCPDFYNPVDGDEVPVPHFGLALTEKQFHDLAEKVKKAGIDFIIEPHLRFEGMPGEQWTMFFKDPSGNNLEFKAMTTPENLFARYDVNS